MIDLPYPEDDSPDLSDDEVAEATPTSNPQELSSALLHLCCPSCEKPLKPYKHRNLRRKPEMYMRMTFYCEDNHEFNRTFRTTWILRAT